MPEAPHLCFFEVFLHLHVDEVKRVILVLERLVGGVQLGVVLLEDGYPLLQRLTLGSRLGQPAGK